MKYCIHDGRPARLRAHGEGVPRGEYLQPDGTWIEAEKWDGLDEADEVPEELVLDFWKTPRT